jgi:hypothetical protein
MRFARVLGVLVLALAIPACVTGHDARQVIKAEPDAVYSGFADAFSQGSMGGASQYSNLWHGGMQTLVEKPSGTAMDVVTKFDGKLATAVHFTFTSQNGGKATLVEADVSVDHAVMHEALAGTPMEAKGNLPDAAFAAGMQRLIAKYAARMEAGTPLNETSEGWMTAGGDPPPEFYEGMPEEQRAEIRRHDEERNEEAATAPAVDPDAAARAYLNGRGPSANVDRAR